MAGTVRDNALIGQVVANYRVGPLLGRGGMGAVYEVTHQYLGRRGALKVLHSQFARTPELASRFVNEARAANQVQHPSVVSVFEIGLLPDSTPYILMEYLDGQPLSKRIGELAKQFDTTPKGAAARIVWSLQLVRQLASALQALHERGVIHRDLKPDNVVIVKDREAPSGERAKLLDFGIAKIGDEFAPAGESPFPGVPAQVKTALGALLGTPVYMAPEQWRGKGNVDHRADLYALGCILFELLTGRPPYGASAIAQLMQMHVWQEPPSALFEQRGVPRQLAELVQKMLAKEPGNRPTTAQVELELGQILDQVMNPSAPAPAPTPAAQQAATVVIRPSALKSSDDTIPAGRLTPQELAKLSSHALPATQRGPLSLPPTEPARYIRPTADGKGAQAATSSDAAVTPLVRRTASGSGHLIYIPPVRRGLRSYLVQAALVLVATFVAEEMLINRMVPHVAISQEIVKEFSQPIPIPLPLPDFPWKIRSAPAGTDVYVIEGKSRRLLGKTPYLYSDPKYQEAELVLSRPDFQERHITIDWTHRVQVAVKLKSKTKAGKAKGR